MHALALVLHVACAPFRASRAWRAACGALSSLLRGRPALVDAYVAAATTGVAKGDPSLVAALAEAWRQCGGTAPAPAEAMEALLACWSKHVAGAAAPVAEAIDAFAPLLSGVFVVVCAGHGEFTAPCQGWPVWAPDPLHMGGYLACSAQHGNLNQVTNHTNHVA